MDSTDTESDAQDGADAPGADRPRRLHTLVRWLPAAVLAVVLAASIGVVVRSDGPPNGSSAAEDASARRSDVPVFSVRRSLDPLLLRSADARLVARLDEFVASQPADTCLVVRTGDVAYEHRADDPQVPASLQKLLTATAALLELGPDATYLTEVLGPTPAAGVVTGNVFLRGGGDPILATAPYIARERNQPQIFSDFDRLADAVVAAGITRIDGAIVGDDTRYDGERYNPAWPSRFLAQGQIGPITALSVNDGFAFFPDETGSFGAAPDPAQYAAQVLTDALRARGVEVVADPISGVTAPGVSSIATHESPPMTDILTQMLRESDNNTAELVLKELGVRERGTGSFVAGRAVVTEALDAAGLELDGTTVADGSGLASENQVDCDLVADLLDHQPTAETLDASLAVAGESGTLARRWQDTDLVGRVRAKTGTLNQVTGLAGSAEIRAGEPARFALLVNLPATEAISAEIIGGQQRLAEILTAHPDLPDVSALRPDADDGS